MDSTAGLTARTAALGEYFALPAPDAGEWHELATLFDDDVLADFVDRTQRAIATASGCDPAQIPTRVAASSFQLGIAARLLSPAVGAGTCFTALPRLNGNSVVWQQSPQHSPKLAFRTPEWVPNPTPERAAEVISTSVVRTAIAPLNEKLATVLSLSSQVSWGNVISAANGAVTVLAMSQPQHERAGRTLVRALLDIEPLHGTGEFSNGRFLRRSCCLFYQAPRSGLCGDCVLAVSGGSH
ncbi:(2Fe-2S)-binding protein [soil metagenome]